MNKYDKVDVGSLVTSNYLKNTSNINSTSLFILYKAKYRPDLAPQDPNVINDGINDNSQVFEIQGRT